MNLRVVSFAVGLTFLVTAAMTPWVPDDKSWIGFIIGPAALLLSWPIFGDKS